MSIPKNNDIVVIGSGLGGLTCAVEMARHGLKVCVLEQRNTPGGSAQSFTRDGYSFDVSLHCAGGLSEGSMLHGVLDELGVLKKLKLNLLSGLCQTEFPDFSISVPNDANEIVNALGRLFPDERRGLVQLFNQMSAIKRDVVEPWLSPNFDSSAEDRPSRNYYDKTFDDLLRGYISHPRLIALLGQFWMYLGLPPSQSTATFSSCVFGSLFLEGAYHIDGGGAALTRALVERLNELGGACVTGATVNQIITEDGRAQGVRLESGETVSARVVVSNANPYQTFFELIPGDEVSKIYRHRLGMMRSSLSAYAIYLGLDCLPSEIDIPPGNLFYNHQTDFEHSYKLALAGDLENTDWTMTSYEGSNVTQSPAGTSVVCFSELTPTGEWLGLDEASYKQRKKEVQAILLAKYSKRFGDLAKHIAVSEFVTPRTITRYTRNHLGAIFGFAQTVEQSNSRRLGNRSPLGGLFLTGAWTWAGGGYEGAMMSGIQTSSSVLAQMDVPRKPMNINLAGPVLTSLDKVEDPSSKHPMIDRANENEHYPFRLKINVYGEDVSPLNVASPSAYLRYIDRGRVEAIEEMCRIEGKESWLTAYVVNVYKMEIRFVDNSRTGEHLEVLTGVRKISSHRAVFDQRIVGTDGRLIVDAGVEVAFLDPDDRNLMMVPRNIIERQKKAVLEGKIAPIPFYNADHFPFREKFRVYYEDTDAQAIAYHVSYVRFCTRSLFGIIGKVWTERVQSWMRQHRVTISWMEVRYLNSSYLGDVLEVRTGVRQLFGDHLLVDQRIVDSKDGKVLADVIIELQFEDEKGNVAPVPKKIVDLYSRIKPEER